MSTPAASPRNRTVLFSVLGAIFAALVVVIIIVVARPGMEGHYGVTDGKVTIEVATIGSLGPVLVTDQGYALYMFPPDAQHAVTCEGRCAGNWPPLFLPDNARLVAGPGVDADLLTTTETSDGKQVASYNGWPLYTYLGDITPGTATGQDQWRDGGYWYVLRPNGTVLEPGSQK